MPRAQIPNLPAGANDFAPGQLSISQSQMYGRPGGGQRPTVNGRELTDQELRALREYFGGLADENRDRFDIGTKYGYDQLSSLDQQRKAAARQAQEQLAEERRQYDQTHGLNQQKFGEERRQFDVKSADDRLKTAAGMRGALNFVQGDMYAQGAQGMSPWIASLRSGQPVQYGGGTATTGNPTPLTMQTLGTAMGAASPMTGAATTEGPGQGTAARSVGGPDSLDAYGRPRLSPGVQAAVDAGSAAFQGGLANKGLGWLENQTDEQQEALTSIGDYLGRNTRSEKQYYYRSRPGQRSAALA